MASKKTAKRKASAARRPKAASKKPKYNGWTNWQTWNVALWFDNEQPLYHAYRRFVKTAARVNADTVEKFIREYLPNGTPDMKSSAEYRGVNWGEISKNWKSE